MKIINSLLIGLILFILGIVGIIQFFVFFIGSVTISALGQLLSGEKFEFWPYFFGTLFYLCITLTIFSPILFWIIIPFNNKFHFVSRLRKRRTLLVSEGAKITISKTEYERALEALDKVDLKSVKKILEDAQKATIPEEKITIPKEEIEKIPEELKARISEPRILLCSICGRESPLGALYCDKCGNRLLSQRTD